MLNDRLDEPISQKYRRKPITRNMDIRITGKNDRPPKRGTGVVCTLRESGTSYNRFLWEITKILGMITIPNSTEKRKPDSNSNVICMICVLVISSCHRPRNRNHSRSHNRIPCRSRISCRNRSRSCSCSIFYINNFKL